MEMLLPRVETFASKTLVQLLSIATLVDSTVLINEHCLLGRITAGALGRQRFPIAPWAQVQIAVPAEPMLHAEFGAVMEV